MSRDVQHSWESDPNSLKPHAKFQQIIRDLPEVRATPELGRWCVYTWEESRKVGAHVSVRYPVEVRALGRGREWGMRYEIDQASTYYLVLGDLRRDVAVRLALDIVRRFREYVDRNPEVR